MELCIGNNFIELNEYSLGQIEGGTFWGVVGGVATVIGGVASVVGGAALIAAPEPTTATKFAGAGMIVGGIAAVGGGLATIASNI
ncbi:hypothetical protein [Petroclostridium xylanilyticum]|uniref:hypothetical protein n=1 Tax=Petroclostridium xylanilyticum TaxID=1792311 RepID=UPI000B99849D|nr:hypothetical protein [Petroclostridium xylanilyticum]